MAVGHIVSVERKQRMRYLAGSLFSIYSFWDPPVHEVFLPTYRVGFFLSVKTSLEMPRGVSHR